MTPPKEAPMQILHPNTDEARLALRAMSQVAAATAPNPPARRLMEAAQRHLLGTAYDLDALEPITPEELARGYPDPALRRQLVQGMVVASIANGAPAPAQFEVVRRFAAALAVDAPEVETIRRLADGQMLLFRLDFYRHSHLRHAVEDQLRHHGGLPGLVKGLLGQRGHVEDEAVAAPYRALERLPEGTLGRTFFQHCRSHGFSFPGEKGGFPEGIIYHDLTHVLSGYGTDPTGEMLICGFQAGYMRRDTAYMALFGLLTFTAGVNVTPLPQQRSVGLLGEGELAERFLEAVERGARMNTDLSDNWDFWPLVGLPIDEVRERLGIAPAGEGRGS
jgi:hypothetical protein